MNSQTNDRRLPEWFKVRLSTNERFARVRNSIREGNLHTVCQSAACPNRCECWSAGTATFLILGDVCTRGCGFCNIAKGMPQRVDLQEPERVAKAVAALGLTYAVVTSVTRDDLSDGGASLFAETIRAIRMRSPRCKVEVLIPDFQGSASSLQSVLEAMPDVLNHNLETVPAFYARVRPEADYDRSLRLLEQAKARGLTTKSGMMLGLGEGIPEVRRVLADLRRSGCDILTLGQYLRPRKDLLPLVKFYRPEEFGSLREEALAMGFSHVAAGPLVRSSYHAERYAFR
jgi:lipoic acid synthetase